MIILTPEQDQNKNSLIRHIIIKESNMTVYYNGFDELLIIMDVADEFEKNDSASTLTYVIEHAAEEWGIYHTGIDETYSNDGHYHFRRKDKQVLTLGDIQLLLATLHKYSLLTIKQCNSLSQQILEVSKSNGLYNQLPASKLSFFSYSEEEELKSEESLLVASLKSGGFE